MQQTNNVLLCCGLFCKTLPNDDLYDIIGAQFTLYANSLVKSYREKYKIHLYFYSVTPTLELPIFFFMNIVLIRPTFTQVNYYTLWS